MISLPIWRQASQLSAVSKSLSPERLRQSVYVPCLFFSSFLSLSDGTIPCILNTAKGPLPTGGGSFAVRCALTFDTAQRHTADDELGEQQIDDDHRQDGDGHHHVHLANIELEEVCTAQL